MTEFKMNRNGSGAYDGTAYKAFQGMAKGGEIWTANGKQILIVKNHGGCCSCLALYDECKSNYCIEVDGKYTDPRMLQYWFNDSLGRCIGALTASEFETVLCDIEDALSLNIQRQESPEEHEALEAAKRKIKDLEAKLAAEKDKPVAADSIYKRLYDDLIDKLIDKKVM